MFDFTNRFPYPQFRKYQKETIESIFDALQKVDTVVVEAPTGSGKSSIAITLGRTNPYNYQDPRVFQNTYVLTPKKLLQDQYIKDYVNEEEIIDLKGRGNYICPIENVPCNVASCLFSSPCEKCLRFLNSDKTITEKSQDNCQNHHCFKFHNCKEECPYYRQLNRMINSKIAILNYTVAILLNGKKTIKPRPLLICDECHNIEDVLMALVQVTMSNKILRTLDLKIGLPTSWGEINEEEIIEWINSQLCPAISQRIGELKDAVEFVENLKHRYLFEALRTYFSSLQRFLDTQESIRWIFGKERTEDGLQYVLKPLYVHPFGDLLFSLSNKRVLMSATIFDKDGFCNSIGLNPQDIAFIRIPSTFPKENRPIYALSDGLNLSYKYIDVNLPKMGEIIKIILKRHENEKGIIHTHNYRISKYIEANVSDDRLLFHTSANREAQYKLHLGCMVPSVLVSPSMGEGVDLKDELSRFQIICKIPYPYLGDQQIAERTAVDPQWYRWKTGLALVQSYGRSVRSETDSAITYVIDIAFESFVSCGSRMPNWFMEAIRIIKLDDLQLAKTN